MGGTQGRSKSGRLLSIARHGQQPPATPALRLSVQQPITALACQPLPTRRHEVMRDWDAAGDSFMRDRVHAASCMNSCQLLYIRARALTVVDGRKNQLCGCSQSHKSGAFNLLDEKFKASPSIAIRRHPSPLLVHDFDHVASPGTSCRLRVFFVINAHQQSPHGTVNTKMACQMPLSAIPSRLHPEQKLETP